MNYIDLFCIAFMLYFFIMGIKRGLIKEVLSIIGLVLAIAVCYFLGSGVASFAESFIDAKWVNPLSYAILFVSTYLVIKLLASALTKLSKVVALRTVNRILGGTFGLVKALAVLLLLTLLFNALIDRVSIDHDQLKTSVALNVLNDALEAIEPLFNQELL